MTNEIQKPRDKQTETANEQENQIMELASADYDFFVMIVMFDTLGARLGEIQNLLWQNVHLDSSNLFPYGFVDFVKRKNNKNLRLPLSEELQILLQMKVS